MLLAVDAGNTNVVMGLVDATGEPRATIRLATRREGTADELSMAVAHLARRAGVEVAAIERSVLCSVVPGLTRAFLDFARAELAGEPLEVSATMDLGIELAVDDPREVGPDRIVNALAARDAVGVPAIVVDLGTATTFDCLDERGRYVGGVIAPGVETSAEELFRRAARLTKVDFTFPERRLGRNTRDCLRSGTMWGTVDLIDAVVEGLWEEMRVRGSVLATGGLAPLFGSRCRSIDRVDVELTLRGLVLVDRRVAGGPV
jgi:type III pantothenate kinase